MQYSSLREKISAEKKERAERYASFDRLIEQAQRAGDAAATAVVPVPMVVSQRANPLDDTSPVTQQWYVASGVCGFGCVIVYPANCSFARWAVKQGLGRKAYGGGLRLSAYCALRTQSYEINSAFAYAYAKVLCDAGIEAHADCRLD